MGGHRHDEEYLPLLYRLDAGGRPVTLLPYDGFVVLDGLHPPVTHRGLFRRERTNWEGMRGFAWWLQSYSSRLGRRALADRLGIDEAAVRRWINGGYFERERWITLRQIALSTVDRYLTTMDEETLSELYPYLQGPEFNERWCRHCRDRVMADPLTSVCLWCERPTVALDGQVRRDEDFWVALYTNARPTRLAA